MSLFQFDREEFRRVIADENPGELTESLTMMLDACAEVARELRMPLPDLIEMATNRYASAHDKEVTHFEHEEDDTGHSTVTVMADKWRDN